VALTLSCSSKLMNDTEYL